MSDDPVRRRKDDRGPAGGTAYGTPLGIPVDQEAAGAASRKPILCRFRVRTFRDETQIQLLSPLSTGKLADMRAAPVYVVVSGPPGSGKSSLSRPLAATLGLPLVAKDRIKEAMMDSLGAGDLEWSKRVGRAAMRVLFALAADAGAAVLDSTWSPELAPADLATLRAPLIEVYCECPPEVAQARFRERLTTRHPGHHDGDRDYSTRWTSARPLGIAPLVVVDTSREVDVGSIAAEIRSQPGWPDRSS
ncbi:MAG: AAA family ATPase [Actinomycetota bacterium]|nr:AAA family ATPase [Actinomycetota bacterium]